MKLRAKRMLELMTIHRMSQADLAAAIGASPSLISHVLKGRRRLNLLHSKRLINLFGADKMAYIIDWDAMGIQAPLGV